MGSRKDRLNAEAIRRREAILYKDLLKKNTNLLKQDVGSFISGKDKELKEMGLALKDSLVESNRNRLEAEVRRKLAEVAEAKKRGEFIDNLHNEVSVVLKNCCKQHKEMTATMHKALADYKKFIGASENGRKQAAIEEARQRAEMVLLIQNITKSYLYDLKHRYKNYLYKYLLDLLDLDFRSEKIIS